MNARPRPGSFTAAFVELQLEMAGRTLLALPWAGCFPVGMASLLLAIGDSAERRYDVPTSSAISGMDARRREDMDAVEHQKCYKSTR